MASTHVYRRLHLVGALVGEQVRLETFRGAEHVVAPVVMMVGDSVIFPMGATVHEFVPASVLAVAPTAWNGRPVVAGDHPQQDGQPLSANDPIVLERMGFGHIFNAEFRDNRLIGEAWIDVARAGQVEDGAEILGRVQAREQVEISIGAYVVAEAREGRSPSGQTYGAIWREIAGQDHLALLRQGLTGACSVAAGCGTPRASVRHLVSQSGVTMLASADGSPREDDVTEKSLKDKLFGLFVAEPRAAQNPTEMSDEERRELLAEGLKRVESQFMRVMSVTGLDGGEVVYLIDPDPGGPSPLRPYQRSYTISAEGRPTFSDERVPVRMSTQWVPLLAKSGTPTAAAGSCGCESGQAGADAGAGGTAMTHRNAERIKALIENDKLPWQAADQPYLEGLTDERLVAFEEAAKPVQVTDVDADAAAAGAGAQTETANTETPAAEAAAARAATPKPKSEAEWLAEAPASLRDMVSRQQRADVARRTSLVGLLKDAANGAYTETELTAMPLDQLERLAKVARAAVPEVDYAGLGSGLSSDQAEVIEAPKPWDLALARRKGTAA